MKDPEWEQMQARLAAEEQFIAARGGQQWIDLYVAPHYLKWMEIEAATGEGLSFRQLSEIRARAAELDRADIVSMLGMQWRLQVMGAWYAIARNDQTLAPAVHRGFTWCFGSLTSAPLAAAALTYREPMTAGVLRGYLARSRSAGYGDDAIIEAALRRVTPDDGARFMAPETEILDRLLMVAGALRGPGI